jgi:hypothetical protein
MGDGHDEGRRVLLPLEVGGEAPQNRGVVWTLLAVGFAVTAFLASRLTAFSSGVSALARLTGSAGALVLALAALVARAWARRPAPQKPTSRSAAIAADSRGIWRVGTEGEPAPIARWDEPFGVLVLVNPPRTRAVLAFTSPERTRLVAVRIDGDGARPWLDNAVTITDADLDEALAGFRHGFLSARSAETLLGMIASRASSSLGRIDLVDASGAKVTLEGDKLGARDKVIDLGEPVEWRSFTFHEAASGATAAVVYQATWVRQGTTELVLVCPLPADASSLGLGRASNHPPARENRVAIDRLFMAPLRRALEGAPRISRTGATTRTSSHAIPTQ